jgi:predicted 3-demethylubiquinone-9 3-methyltransferase (glyoxalase superfamily)
MQKITPYLWFDNQAEEAMQFYTSTFKNSKIINVSRYPEGAPGVAGTVMTGTIQIEGQEFIVLNGGPQYKFTEAISFFVNCKTQEEVDDLWAKLTANGGEEGPCGWCKDKFGVSWQIIPELLGQLLGDPNPVKAQAAMQAMLQMKKIDSAKLREAYEHAVTA